MDESPKRGLLAAYGRLLGPLIRILIRNGVTLDEFSEVVKHNFVKVATSEALKDGSEQPETRVAALTGMNLAEVEETQRAIKAMEDQDQNTLDGIVRILTAWHTDSDFTGPYGIPLEVRFEDEQHVSFSSLAELCFPNYDARLLLEKLVRVGLVVETEKGWFKVLARRYRPEGHAPDGLEHLARTFEDLVNTIDHNLIESDPKKRLFERQVYTEDGIKAEDLPRFQEFVNHRANLLLEEIDNWLTQLDKPKEPEEQRISTGLGIFNYLHIGKQQ